MRISTRCALPRAPTESRWLRTPDRALPCTRSSRRSGARAPPTPRTTMLAPRRGGARRGRIAARSRRPRACGNRPRRALHARHRWRRRHVVHPLSGRRWRYQNHVRPTRTSQRRSSVWTCCLARSASPSVFFVGLGTFFFGETPRCRACAASWARSDGAPSQQELPPHASRARTRTEAKLTKKNVCCFRDACAQLHCTTRKTPPQNKKLLPPLPYVPSCRKYTCSMCIFSGVCIVRIRST